MEYIIPLNKSYPVCPESIFYNVFIHKHNLKRERKNGKRHTFIIINPNRSVIQLAAKVIGLNRLLYRMLMFHTKHSTIL